MTYTVLQAHHAGLPQVARKRKGEWSAFAVAGVLEVEHRSVIRRFVGIEAIWHDAIAHLPVVDIIHRRSSLTIEHAHAMRAGGRVVWILRSKPLDVDVVITGIKISSLIFQQWKIFNNRTMQFRNRARRYLHALGTFVVDGLFAQGDVNLATEIGQH